MNMIAGGGGGGLLSDKAGPHELKLFASYVAQVQGIEDAKTGWEDGRAVLSEVEKSLNTHISRLEDAFGDNPDGPGYAAKEAFLKVRRRVTKRREEMSRVKAALTRSDRAVAAAQADFRALPPVMDAPDAGTTPNPAQLGRKKERHEAERNARETAAKKAIDAFELELRGTRDDMRAIVDEDYRPVSSGDTGPGSHASPLPGGGNRPVPDGPKSGVIGPIEGPPGDDGLDDGTDGPIDNGPIDNPPIDNGPIDNGPIGGGPDHPDGPGSGDDSGPGTVLGGGPAVNPDPPTTGGGSIGGGTGGGTAGGAATAGTGMTVGATGVTMSRAGAGTPVPGTSAIGRTPTGAAGTRGATSSRGLTPGQSGARAGGRGAGGRGVPGSGGTRGQGRKGGKDRDKRTDHLAFLDEETWLDDDAASDSVID